MWNNEYPMKLGFDSIIEFNGYLENLQKLSHILLKDENMIKAWYFDFVRENERFFALILSSSVQGKGIGTEILNLAKAKENELNAWVVDHNNDYKRNGEPYYSPLSFYMKNHFEVLNSQRLELEEISAVKIRWRKFQNISSPTMNFQEIKYGSNDWLNAVALREKILREPLGSIFSKQELEEEKNHIHIAGFLKDELISGAVLVPEKDKLKMQRVVVHEKLRNKNIGTEMIQYCEALAFEKGYRFIYCHARDSAVNFYKQNDYLKEGEYFDEDGIPHLKMVKNLK